MKKCYLKIFSLLLSIALLIGIVPVNTLAVVDADATLETNLANVTTLESDIANTEKNIVLGYSTATEGTEGSYSVRQTYGDVVNQNINNKIDNGQYITDGVINSSGTASSSHADVKSFAQTPAEGEWVDGYVDFTFTFPNTAEITNLFIASANNAHFTSHAYDVYVSNDLGGLYSEENRVYSYDNTNHATAQYITFSSTLEARYLGIRITKLVWEGNTSTYDYSYCRIREIAVIGTCDIPEEQKITNLAAANQCIADLKTDKNLLQSGYITRNEDLPSSVMYTGSNQGEAVSGGITTNSSGGAGNEMIDGDVSTNADANLKITYYNDETKEFYDNSYQDVTFVLANEATIEKIFFAQRNDAKLMANEYEIYVGNTYDDLYTEANRKWAYVNSTNAVYQTFSFKTPVDAKYVGIRFRKPITFPQWTLGVGSAYLRLAEIAIFGEYKAAPIDPTIQAKIIDTAAANECIAALKTASNLLQSGYTVRDEDLPSSVRYNGSNRGTAVTGGISTTNVTANDMIDGDVNTTADSNVKVTFYDTATNEFYKDSYQDVTFVLRNEATIDKIFLAQRTDIRLMAKEYEIYVGNSYNTLYTEANRQWSFVNESNARYQTFKFDTPVTAKYVGIRFRKPITFPQWNLEVGSAYLRLAEIAIFGNYNVPYYDYSVTSNVGDFVNDIGKIYQDVDFNYTVPLVRDGYTFVKWQINGEDAESVIDRNHNTSSISFKLTDNMNVVAVYQEDPTALTSSTFNIKDGKVCLPLKSIAWEARQGFDQYPENIAIKDGDNFYRDGEYITEDMKLVLYAGNEIAQALDIVPQYDYNGDSDVNVTDITAAISGMLGETELTEYGEFTFDGNCSGTLTVSDVVGARNDIMTRPDGTTDYQTRGSNMQDFKYKSMGRTILNEDNSLFFENAASGILFNADCYGDVIANVTTKGAELTYYTLIIDGKKAEVTTHFRGDQPLYLAKDLPKGEHSFELYINTEGLTIKDITLNGEILDAPENRDLYIEFVGDSITSGVDTLWLDLDEDGKTERIDPTRTSNAYLSYSVLTAQALGADWSNVSIGGGTMVDQRSNNRSWIPLVYKQNTLYSTGTEYTFPRKSDILVVNLGTNDEQWLTKAYGNDPAKHQELFAAALDDLIEYALEKNGRDVKIVFAFGLMSGSTGTTSETPHAFAHNAYKAKVESLRAEGIDAHYIRLTARRGGGNGHPSYLDDIEAAKELADFIKTNVLD